MFCPFKKLPVLVLAHLLLAPLNNTSQTIHLLIEIQINSLPYIMIDFIEINRKENYPPLWKKTGLSSVNQEFTNQR
jgi:hypothetical protein